MGIQTFTGPIVDAGGQVFNVRAYGADPTGGTDSTAAFVTAYNAAAAVSPAAAVVFIPPGTYSLSSSTIALGIYANRVSLIGSGRETTQINFVPTANGAVCIQVGPLVGGPGANYDIVQNHLADFTVTSSDTTYQKIALNIVGASELVAERLNVINWTNSNNSVGLQIRGHNACWFLNNSIENVDIPLYIRSNPNSPYRSGTVYQDLDHFNFLNLYLESASSTYPCILIDSGVTWTALSLTGDQSWVAGAGGIQFIDTATTQVVGGLVISGRVRWEESPTSGGWFVNLQANHALQDLVIDSSLSVDGTAHNGIKLRNAYYGAIRNYTYNGTHTALDIDTSDTIEIGGGSYFQAGSTVSVGANAKRVTGAYNLGGTLVTLQSQGFVTTAISYTMTAANSGVLANASGGSLTVTLPSAASAINRIVTVSKTDASTNTVTVACAGADTFLAGGTTVALTAVDAPVTYFSNGSQWCKTGNPGAIGSTLNVSTLNASQSVTGVTGTFGVVYPNIICNNTVTGTSAGAADFESDIGPWRFNPSQSTCTMAQSTDYALHGSHSLKVTANASGNFTFLSVQSGPVTSCQVSGGTQYFISANFRSAVTARAVQIVVDAYDSGSNFLGKIGDSGEGTQDNASGWTLVSVSVVTPATCKYLNILLQIDALSGNIANNEVHYIDEVLLSQSPVWTLPGASLPQAAFDSNGHLTFTGGSPSIAAGAGAGTSPTVSVTGSDSRGLISVTTGTTPSVSATIATVTFIAAYSATPGNVTVTPANALAAALSGGSCVFEDEASRGTTGFSIKVGSGGLPGSTGPYLWNYRVDG